MDSDILTKTGTSLTEFPPSALCPDEETDIGTRLRKSYGLGAAESAANAPRERIARPTEARTNFNRFIGNILSCS